MSSIRLPQKVTYWNPLTVDTNGDIAYSVGVAVAARWVKKDGLVRGVDGEDQKTTHVVYAKTLIPKRAQISLSDLNGQALPAEDAREVIDNVDNRSMSNIFKMVL